MAMCVSLIPSIFGSFFELEYISLKAYPWSCAHSLLVRLDSRFFCVRGASERLEISKLSKLKTFWPRAVVAEPTVTEAKEFYLKELKFISMQKISKPRI